MSRTPVAFFFVAAVWIWSLASSSPAHAAALPSSRVYVNVGAGAVENWRADPGPSGDATTGIGTITSALDLSGVERPAPAAVYKSYRYGKYFTYRIGGLIPNASYSVRLHFAEPTATGAGQRLFNVQINALPALAKIDVYALAKAQNRAVALIAPATANATGQVAITFIGLNGTDAVVSAIELQQAILIRNGGSAVGSWQSDPGPSSGVASYTYLTSAGIDMSGVSQPAPEAVYQSDRYGQNFTYTISGLAPGAAYTVRLHFADPYCWYVGCRFFNVSINGAPAVWNFDIFAAAGAQNRATTRSFGTNASSAGQIVINFVAQLNDATVSGIEVQSADFVPASAVDNTTNHYDNLRTSWDPQEQALTTAHVNAASFGLLRTLAVDGSVDAQPLVATGINIPTLGARHDLLIVATAKDSVYAFDASSGALIWQRSLVGDGERGLTTDDVDGCPSNEPDIGIMGTPVINRASDTLYVDVPTYSKTTASYHNRLHALDLTSGADQVTPVEVTGSVAATGQAFNTQFERQRAGLTLASGNVYVAFTSFCDFNVDTANDPVVGWLIGFNGSTLAPISPGDPFSTSLLNTIWQGGVAPAADVQGNLFVATGNGPYDGTANLDNSIVKLAPTLGRLDSFTTRNQATETADDYDLSSGGVMLLPDEPGSYPHLALHEGKVPALRVLNRDYLGGYTGGVGNPENILTYAYIGSCDPTIDISCAVYNSEAAGVYGGLAYYAGPNGTQYAVVADAVSNVHTYAIGTGSSVTLKLAARSKVALPNEGGASPLVTSNGTLAGSAIVWLLDRADPTFNLEAYDASTLALIYSTKAGQWNGSNAGSMLVPTVADGKVFVGSQVLNQGENLIGGRVAVYGLLKPVTPYPDARSAAAPALTPIRLAGPVVYGPGSRIVARSMPRHIAPVPLVPRAAHAFYGILRRDEGGVMAFALRSGRIVSVDARDAIARGAYSRERRVGNVCYVAVNSIAGRSALTAVTIVHSPRALRDLPPDR